MHKKLTTVFALFITSLALITSIALASEKYITDELTVYLRRGPGMQYKIIGSLKSGDKVSVLASSPDEKYMQIKYGKDRIAWIESDVLTDSPNSKEQLLTLEQELSILNEKAINSDQNKQSLIDNYTNQLNMANQKIRELENSKNQLQQQVKEQQLQIDQWDGSRQDLLLTWFTRGGLVAGVGLILGLVLPFIMPKRRRKKGIWTN